MCPVHDQHGSSVPSMMYWVSGSRSSAVGTHPDVAAGMSGVIADIARLMVGWETPNDKSELKAERKAKVAEMSRILGDGQRSLSNADRERFDSLKLDVGSIDNRISSLVNGVPDDRGRMPSTTRTRGKRDVEGRAGEQIPQCPYWAGRDRFKLERFH